MQLVRDLGSEHGVAPTCAALGVSRATFYRNQRPRPELLARPSPPRALAHEERQAVLEILHEPRFVDLAPAEVFATLLDEECSERTLQVRRDESMHQVGLLMTAVSYAENQARSRFVTELPTDKHVLSIILEFQRTCSTDNDD